MRATEPHGLRPLATRALWAIWVLACPCGQRPALADNPEPPGTSVITTWQDGADAAYSLTFDDNRVQHIDPEIGAMARLANHGLRGTFNVNPGRASWATCSEAYAAGAVDWGHELASHTMSHRYWRAEPSLDAASPLERHMGFALRDNHYWTVEEARNLLHVDATQATQLLDAIQPRATVTLAYPWNTAESVSKDIALGYFLCARQSGAQVNPPTPASMASIRAFWNGVTARYDTIADPTSPTDIYVVPGTLDTVTSDSYTFPFRLKGLLVHLGGGAPTLDDGLYLVIDVDTNDNELKLARPCTTNADAGSVEAGWLVGLDFTDEQQCVALFDQRHDHAAASGGWLVEYWHDIDWDAGGNDGSINGVAFDAHLAGLADRSDIWTAPMGDVARYIRQRDAATIRIVQSSPQLVQLVVDDGLNDALFDVALTVRTLIPDSWADGVAATHRGRPIPTLIDVEGRSLCVQFNVPADGGIIRLRPAGLMDTSDDGRLGLDDFYKLSACLASPSDEPADSCRPMFDVDEDGHIDLRDFAVFQTAFDGLPE